MMRFLADENVPLPSITLLRQSGHNVLAVSEDLSGAADAAVLERAVVEQRILLTFDRDYGELIFRQGLPAPPGVVHLRVLLQTPAETAEVVLALCAQDELTLIDHYTVVDPPRIRQRPLP